MGSPLDVLRQRLGDELRSRVAGERAEEAAARIWRTEGERWFTPDDPIWWVHADAAMFPGGIAALLLQSLHPLAMAGVAGHSGYKSDPWGRLQRTSHFIAVTTYGTVADAEAAIEQVRRIHERVRGRDFHGRAYRADDPHLLRWVHVAEVWSFLRSYQAYAGRRLSPAHADAYVAQAGRAARRLGAVDVPVSVSGLEAALASYRPELEATPAAREATRFLLLDPPLAVPLRPGYAALAAGGVALLPLWARRALHIPVFGLGTLLSGAAGRAGTMTVRWAMAPTRTPVPGEL